MHHWISLASLSGALSSTHATGFLKNSSKIFSDIKIISLKYSKDFFLSKIYMAPTDAL